jgi:hypothetical protein
VVFRPDIILNLPKQLLRQNHLWREARPWQVSDIVLQYGYY